MNPDRASAFVVALTGGIAAGKSAAAERYSCMGVPVFDADAAARSVVAKGQPALHQIVAEFGAGALNASGELDRVRMRERVFADATARRRLEAIVHPQVRRALRQQVDACVAPYCIVAIPLLAETRADYLWVDRVLLVDVPVEVQLTRLIARPGIDRTTALNILAAQSSRSTRLAFAEDIIDTAAPLSWLDSAAQRLHQRYQLLAAAKHARSTRPEG